MSGLSQLDFLERLSSGKPVTLQERIDYLEQCYRTDRLSRDTREVLATQIEDLKTRLAREQSERA